MEREEGARELCCVGGWLLCVESLFVYRIECCEKNFSGDDLLLRMRSLVLPLPQWLLLINSRPVQFIHSGQRKLRLWRI